MRNCHDNGRDGRMRADRGALAVSVRRRPLEPDASRRPRDAATKDGIRGGHADRTIAALGKAVAVARTSVSELHREPASRLPPMVRRALADRGEGSGWSAVQRRAEGGARILGRARHGAGDCARRRAGRRRSRRSGADHAARGPARVSVPNGVEHAKLTLLVRDRCARVLVASANLTRSGYRRSRELASARELQSR
jgi:hypothetical protein